MSNKHPKIYVDLNEMVAPGLYLLSQTDNQTDIEGNTVSFEEGQTIAVFTEINSSSIEFLAEGTVQRNHASDWSSHVKWLVSIPIAEQDLEEH
jgi:hypothetical protein